MWFILFFVLALVALAYWPISRPLPATSISIAFIGYTNAPNTSLRFALFCVTNQDRLAVRWRGISTEVQGDANLKAPVINRSLPWIGSPGRPPVPLKAGQTFVFAVGEPRDGDTWRVQVGFSRVTIKERMFQFRFAHKLPPIVDRFLPGLPPVNSANSEWVQP